ncbi:questin oxidase family protein [Ideonella sp. YS5]|uniref:questin oxidase family protein n=1 Tax=Ideonella sp. YS5 TaxID=3453714 RepID=UPI003EF01BE2
MTIDRPTLHRALDSSLAYACSYPAGALQLSNHLPMTLTALWQLGAPADALEPQLQRATRRLVPLAADSPEGEAARRYARDIELNGLPAVLAVELPGLLQAAETAAFHGLIRLAYALSAQHTGESAHALAAWSTARTSLGEHLPAGLGQPGASIAATLEALRGRSELSFQPPAGTTITSDLQACAALPGFEAAVSGPQAPGDDALTLDALAEASLAVYLASRDFTALHLVTACHAWRLVEPWSGLDEIESRAARRGLWRAWLAAWLSIGRPVPDFAAVHAGRADEADWRAALPTLASTPDEHRIKLAWTALDEWRHRGWPGYARVLPSREASA